MIALGFASAIVPELSLEEVLSLAARIGYRCVEVMCWPPSKADRRYAGVTHLDVDRLDAVELREVHRLQAETKVAISALGYYPNCLSPDPQESAKAIEHLGKVIDAASKLGLGKVNTFIGRDWTKSVADNWPRMVEVWRPLVAQAGSLGVKIGIENCPMSFTADEWPGGKNLAVSPAIWRQLFDALKSSYLGLNYDPSHMVWQQMDYLRPMEDFKERMFHVHAKDVRVDRRRLNEVGILAHPLEYHSPKLPGLGDIDWGQFFSVLLESGYRGPVCVEVEDRAYEGSLEDRIAALEQSFRYLSQFLPV
jgi:sugar phosphate isomerase/epimerase